MARCFEYVLVSQDRAVHPENIVTLLHISTPPDFFNVSLKLGAQWTHIPATVEAPVEFSRLEDKALALAEGHDFFHADGIGVVFVGHFLLGLWGRELSRALAGKQGLER